jgi:CRP-like cAMP-binding protein
MAKGDSDDVIEMNAIEINVLNPGDTFGELSLLDSDSRTTANVDAKEDCEFACMDRK